MQLNEDAERLIELMFRLRNCLHRYRQQTDKGRTYVMLGSLREYEKRRGKPVTVSEIAHASGLALPNVSRLLTPLEQSGLVERVKCGRTVNVIVTKEGERRLKEYWDGFTTLIAEALEGIGQEEKDALLYAGAKIADHMERHTAKGASETANV